MVGARRWQGTWGFLESHACVLSYMSGLAAQWPRLKPQPQITHFPRSMMARQGSTPPGGATLTG